MNKTTIEWTDFSSNPIYAVDRESGTRGHHCVKVSAGCAHCYAEKLNMTARFGGTGLAYVAKNTERVEFKLNHAELESWTRRVKPAKVFIGDMTDIFQEAVPDDFLHAIFHAIEESVLTFQLLTKRPERLARWCEEFKYRLPENVWIGTSVENQATAEERIPHLLQIPARVRFLSCEPLLGAVDLTSLKIKDCYIDVLQGELRYDLLFGVTQGVVRNKKQRINWVIAGGESGAKARPMHPDWARGLRDQCVTAGVPYFFKQWGEFVPCYQTVAGLTYSLITPPKTVWLHADGSTAAGTWLPDGRETLIFAGKKASGRCLDGRQWNEFP